MGVGLARLADGAAMADRLGLSTRRPLHLWLRDHGGRPGTPRYRYPPRLVADVLEAPWPHNVRLAVALVVPPPSFVRATHPGAERGGAALARAHLRRLVPTRRRHRRSVQPRPGASHR